MENISQTPQFLPSSPREIASLTRSQAGQAEAENVAREVVTFHLAPSLIQEISPIENRIIRQEEPSSLTEKLQEAASLHLSIVTSSAPQVPQASVPRNRQRVSFNSVTRHLSNFPDLSAAQGRDEEVALLYRDMRIKNWQEIIGRYSRAGVHRDDLAWDALKGFSQGDLTPEQFSNATFCWAMLNEFSHPQVKIQSLFDAQGDTDLVAKEAVMQGLQFSGSFLGGELERLANGFFEKMRRKPTSEQFFFYLPFDLSEDPEQQSTFTVRQFMREELAFNIFDRFDLTDQRLRSHDPGYIKHFQMIPSFSMIQALIDAYAEDNAVALCPTLGLSDEEDFQRNAREGGREFFLPFPGLPLPRSADGVPAPDIFQFLSHEIYHGLTASQVPDFCRKEVARIADLLSLLKEQFAHDDYPFTQLYLESLRITLLDMDFADFRPSNRFRFKIRAATNDLSDAELFLMELQRQATLVVKYYMKRTLADQLLPEERSALSEQEQAQLQRWDAIRPQSGSAQEKRLAFLHGFNHFCSQTPIFAALSMAMKQDGFFQRFALGDLRDKIGRAEGFGSLETMSDNANLIAHLALLQKTL